MAPMRVASHDEVESRKIVGITTERVTNVGSTDFPGHYPGEDYSWDIDAFRAAFSVTFYKNEAYDASFSLIGIDASIANAFRRILISSLPILAIEDVFVMNNTSIVQDEVLAQRLGLVPLTGSQAGLRWMQWPEEAIEGQPLPTPSDNNTIVMKLHVQCTANASAKRGETDPLELYNHAHVYARDLVWTPVGSQSERFADGPIRPVHPDILLAKMRPGQEIELDMHCVKGIGSDHAKFSPVATASYRLLPTIKIVKPILGADAKKFARCFPKGVIGLEEVSEDEAAIEGSGFIGHVGEKKAVVRNAFKDTVSRECLRHEEFEGKVKLGRVRDHFIFSVESTGQFESDELFLDSVKLLKSKCLDFRRDLANIMH